MWLPCLLPRTSSVCNARYNARPDQPTFSQLCAVKPEISKIQYGQLCYARFWNGRLQTHRQYAEDDDKTWRWLVAREWPGRIVASLAPANVPTCQRPWPPIPSHLPGNNASTEIAWLEPEGCRSAADNSSPLAGPLLSASSPAPSPNDRSRFVRVSRAGPEAARIVPAISTSRARFCSPSGRLRARVVHARSSRFPRSPWRVHSRWLAAPPPARFRHKHPVDRLEGSVRPCRASLPGVTVARATTRPLACTILEFLEPSSLRGTSRETRATNSSGCLARKSLPTAAVTVDLSAGISTLWNRSFAQTFLRATVRAGIRPVEYVRGFSRDFRSLVYFPAVVENSEGVRVYCAHERRNFYPPRALVCVYVYYEALVSSGYVSGYGGIAKKRVL